MAFMHIEICRNVLNIYFYLYWMREDFSEKEPTRFIKSPNNMKCGLSRSARCLWWWLRPGWACPWHTPSAPSLIRTPYPLLLNLAQSLFLSFCRFVSSRFYFWHSSRRGGETGPSCYSYLPGHWRWWHYDDLLLRSPFTCIPQSTTLNPTFPLCCLKINYT